MNFGTIIPKYGEKAKLCYVDTDSFIIYIKNGDFFEDISNDIEKWFGTSNYNKKDKIPLPIGKNKKVAGLFKDELWGKIITEFVSLRPKTYSYLDDNCNEHKNDVMMMKDYKHFMGLQHIHMEQMFLKCVKMKCWR